MILNLILLRLQNMLFLFRLAYCFAASSKLSSSSLLFWLAFNLKSASEFIEGVDAGEGSAPDITTENETPQNDE